MGRMGKPQKSKKHKKLKTTFDSDNPLAGIRKRNTQKNRRPQNDDDQEFPKKVKEIMKFKSKGKNKKSKNNRANETFKMVRGMSEPLKSAPTFVKKDQESDRDFMRRVDIETHRVLTKARIEQKYQVQFQDGDGTDELKVKRDKSERKKEKEKEKKKKKKEAKLMKQMDRKGDFSALQDDVEFGETVMQPPSLTALPRKAQKYETTAKPGKRSLLLKQMMEGSKSSSSSSSSSAADKLERSKVASLTSRQAGQTVKRKLLSPAQQQITDFQRNKAIEQYRQMKLKKMNMQQS